MSHLSKTQQIINIKQKTFVLLLMKCKTIVGTPGIKFFKIGRANEGELYFCFSTLKQGVENIN